jgi:hypothetical protein
MAKPAEDVVRPNGTGGEGRGIVSNPHRSSATTLSLNHWSHLGARILLAHVLRAADRALGLLAVNSALRAFRLLALHFALGTSAHGVAHSRAARVIALPAARRVAVLLLVQTGVAWKRWGRPGRETMRDADKGGRRNGQSSTFAPRRRSISTSVSESTSVATATATIKARTTATTARIWA